MEEPALPFNPLEERLMAELAVSARLGILGVILFAEMGLGGAMAYCAYVYRNRLGATLLMFALTLAVGGFAVLLW